MHGAWLLLATGCGNANPEPPGPYEWKSAPGFPDPAVPEDNPMNAAKVELGRRLFYDKRLSANGTWSCASCHRQEFAFTDGLPKALGSTGEHHRRNSMSLANVAYAASLTWVNPDPTGTRGTGPGASLRRTPRGAGHGGP